MHRQTGRLIRALLLGGLLTLAQAGASYAAAPSSEPTPPANGTLTVSPPIISLAVAPGGTGTTELTLHAGISENVSIEADGLTQGLDGSFQSVSAAQDKSPYSARSMMTFSPQSFQMQAGDSQTVTITVKVPADAGAGTRYAILKITGTPVSSQNVGIGAELGVSSLVTISNSSQEHTGSIRDLAVGKIVEGQPLAVTGTLVNTGNSHYGAMPNQVNTSAVLTNSNGDEIASNRAVMEGNSIVPTFGRQFSLALKSSHALADGSYRLQVAATLQDGTALDNAELDFNVSNGQVRVLGATSGPASGSTGSGSGSDSGGMLLVSSLLVGVLLLALLLGLLVTRTRRAQRRRLVG